jgi:hypothetical protein
VLRRQACSARSRAHAEARAVAAMLANGTITVVVLLAIRSALARVGLVVTDSAAPAVGRWGFVPAAKTRMSTRRQGDKRQSRPAHDQRRLNRLANASRAVPTIRSGSLPS